MTSGQAQGAAYSHGRYIPSIEGMRAIAVLAVLLFHLDIRGVGGGYLGVDLFFVLSGFIISRNILGDIGRGEFSLRDFYIRRIRRLFPALCATVLITLAAALVLMPPAELAQAAKSGIFALLSLANFHFWLESGYFEAAADAKPLLHTWSLSVEEQYYLFWPALLFALGHYRLRLIVTVALLSLSLMAALTQRHLMPDAVFYQLPFRVHQLMAGALLVLLAQPLRGRAADAATLTGIAGFLLSSYCPGTDSPPRLARSGSACWAACCCWAGKAVSPESC